MLRLWIRDNTSGKIHEYGTDSHDSLILQDDGSIHYHNMQNGCGTMYPEEGYTFVHEDGTDPREDPAIAKYGVEAFLEIGGHSVSNNNEQKVNTKE